jgi:hypothetical protein
MKIFKFLLFCFIAIQLTGQQNPVIDYGSHIPNNFVDKYDSSKKLAISKKQFLGLDENGNSYFIMISPASQRTSTSGGFNNFPWFTESWNKSEQAQIVKINASGNELARINIDASSVSNAVYNNGAIYFFSHFVDPPDQEVYNKQCIFSTNCTGTPFTYFTYGLRFYKLTVSSMTLQSHTFSRSESLSANDLSGLKFSFNAGKIIIASTKYNFNLIILSSGVTYANGAMALLRFNESNLSLEYGAFIAIPGLSNGVSAVSLMNNKIYFGGTTYVDGATVGDAYQSNYGGNGDLKFGSYNLVTNLVDYLSFFGNSGQEYFNNMDVDEENVVFGFQNRDSPGLFPEGTMTGTDSKNDAGFLVFSKDFEFKFRKKFGASDYDDRYPSIRFLKILNGKLIISTRFYKNPSSITSLPFTPSIDYKSNELSTYVLTEFDLNSEINTWAKVFQLNRYISSSFPGNIFSTKYGYLLTGNSIIEDNISIGPYAQPSENTSCSDGLYLIDESGEDLFHSPFTRNSNLFQIGNEFVFMATIGSTPLDSSAFITNNAVYTQNTSAPNQVYWGKLKFPDYNLASPNKLAPETQTVCKYGLADVILGTSVKINSSFFQLYRLDGNTVVPPSQTLSYKWQRSTTEEGPWADIPGAVLQDYLPTVQETDYYYRRLAIYLNKDTIYSNPVGVLVDQTKTAPTVDAGPIKYSCAGTNYPITLGGSPTGTVSSTGTSLTYSWNQSHLLDDPTKANPVAI